jgi:hypothetical protein
MRFFDEETAMNIHFVRVLTHRDLGHVINFFSYAIYKCVK